MKVYALTLLRHGQSQGNISRIPQGQTDLPLTDLGRQQAEALAKRWAAEGRSFDRIVCSPLLRAKATVEIVAAALQTPVDYDPIWMERDVGQLSDLDQETLARHYANPDSRSPYHDAFGRDGEGQWALYLRAAEALHKLMNMEAGAYLVVSHGGLLNALMYAILGFAPPAFATGPRFFFDNTGFAELSYEADFHRWALLRFNDTAHLMGSHG